MSKTVPSIMVAPTGARRMKTDHAALPMTTPEIAEAARSCFDAGADRLHLHVRDDEGLHSLDPARYREAIAAVNEAAPDMAIQTTTESAGRFDVSDQYDCLEALRPVAASVAIREMARDPARAAQLYAMAAESSTEVQHILYGPDCAETLGKWFQDATVPGDMRDVIFVLGQYAPALDAAPSDLDPWMEVVQRLDLRWTVCAFGRFEEACLLDAAKKGGALRIGFENNLSREDGTPWRDNAEAVASLASKLAG